jgi:hypothetical protein
VNNVSRHSGSGKPGACAFARILELEWNHGAGLGERNKPGIGLVAMRERAGLLGGAWSAEAAAGRTRYGCVPREKRRTMPDKIRAAGGRYALVRLSCADLEDYDVAVVGRRAMAPPRQLAKS